MIYELHSSDGKVIVIPGKHRTRKAPEFRLPNGDRIVIEGDTMKLYKPGGREFTCVIPKPPVSKPILSEPTV